MVSVLFLAEHIGDKICYGALDFTADLLEACEHWQASGNTCQEYHAEKVWDLNKSVPNLLKDSLIAEHSSLYIS